MFERENPPILSFLKNNDFDEDENYEDEINNIL